MKACPAPQRNEAYFGIVNCAVWYTAAIEAPKWQTIKQKKYHEKYKLSVWHGTLNMSHSVYNSPLKTITHQPYIKPSDIWLNKIRPKATMLFYLMMAENFQ